MCVAKVSVNLRDAVLTAVLLRIQIFWHVTLCCRVSCSMISGCNGASTTLPVCHLYYFVLTILRLLDLEDEAV
jgi:hypothetical protein